MKLKKSYGLIPYEDELNVKHLSSHVAQNKQTNKQTMNQTKREVNERARGCGVRQVHCRRGVSWLGWCKISEEKSCWSVK
jgi:hypothetical protein